MLIAYHIDRLGQRVKEDGEAKKLPEDRLTDRQGKRHNYRLKGRPNKTQN
jgi:hypothetical protein